MLRMIQSTNSASAKSYYTEGLSRDDYYTKGRKQEIVGNWGGKTARMLGLSGQVDRQSFHKLADNLDPRTGAPLTPRTNTYRRVGYDINMHVPKSVSAVFAITNDQDIMTAFRASVSDAMREMEQEMKTRVRRDYRQEDRSTGNMLWAEFVHTTARPVDGIPDPHLHAHCFVFNATYDAEEDRFKAGQFGDLKRDAPYFEAIFHASLSKRLADLGYPIRKDGKFWEIDSVPKSVIDKFSRRTELIEKTAQEKKVTGQKSKDQLGAKTREKKQPELDMVTLQKNWKGRLNVQERYALEHAKTGHPHSKTSARDVVLSAIDHGFERQSVMRAKLLAAEALRLGYGSAVLADVQQHLTADKVITRDLDGDQLCTTRAVLAEEKAMIAAAQAGRGKFKPFVPARFHLRSRELSTEQKQAVEQVLRSRDGVVGVRGAAGVGKTRLMRAAIKAMQWHGKQVLTFAPSAEASRGVLREEGFKTAETVAALLRSKQLQHQIRKQVIWIDESGLLSTKDLRKVLDLAKKQNARVVLSGDTKQHSSVERGDAQRILESHAGVQFAEVGTIRRQTGLYREAVKHLSQGKVEAGFELLDRLGAVQEIQGSERYEKLAKDYVEAIKAKQKVQVVSPTHQEGREVTAQIRSALRANNKIAHREREFLQQRNLQYTRAQRANPELYQPGHRIQFHQHAKGFRAGEQLKVVDIGLKGVTVRRQNGSRSRLPLHHADRFQVYEGQNIGMAAGERIRITQNGATVDRKHRLHNGSIYKVKGFTQDGHIRLLNGWVVDKNYGNLAYGYCVTSHLSQGKTVDRVLIAQSEMSYPASSREQFYVSASRGRKGITVYTDDKEALRKAVTRSGERMSAVELAQDGKEPRYRSERERRLDRLQEPDQAIQQFRQNTHSQRAVQRDDQNRRQPEKDREVDLVKER